MERFPNSWSTTFQNDPYEIPTKKDLSGTEVLLLMNDGSKIVKVLLHVLRMLKDRATEEEHEKYKVVFFTQSKILKKIFKFTDFFIFTVGLCFQQFFSKKSLR